MRIVLINLERASDRRAAMAREFDTAGLRYEIKTAIDARRLTPDQLACVDWENRRRLGLRPQDNGSIACWLTHREVLRDLAANGPDMMAVFEDDARFTPHLAKVLSVLETKPFDFDLVSLYREGYKPFIPCVSLTDDHWAGRVRHSENGTVGYVITRLAARHFLETTPKMLTPIDHDLLRFWVSGLNTFYVDPPVVRHSSAYGSQITEFRRAASTKRGAAPPLILWRRAVDDIRRSVKKRLVFRRLLRGEIGVTRWP